jgi:uncharacterized protein (TIGR03118 family)
MKICRQNFPTRLPALVVGSVALLCLPLVAQAAFLENKLVSDLPGADNLDPNLVNPWGISSSPTSPFWVSDNGTGLSTLYNGQGVPQSLVVTIPGAATPTGQVFNGTSDFNGDRFLFVSEDGTVSGWRGALGTTAETLVPGLPSNVYKGAAFATIGSNSYLYAANFNTGTIDVFKGNAAAPPLSGNFNDPNIPAGFAPFNIQNLGDKLYVTYALKGPTGDDVAGPGNGFVDVFDLNGNLLQRLVTGGVPTSPLNSPWGLALAPANFGDFSNALLVGNFGDGTIHAFDPANGDLLGQFLDTNGSPIVIDGLWGLRVGNAGPGFDPNKLYFTAGIAGPPPGEVEDHGLFGSLQFVPEPGSLALMSGVLAVWLPWRRNNRTRRP